MINESKIHRLLSASKYPGGGFFKALHSRPGASGKGKKLIPGRSGGGGGGGGGVRHREGDQVGDGAERIGGDNVGHKLLSRMG